MKKTAAILLLALMVFNLIGYRLLFNYLETRAQSEMTARLDHNAYNRAGLTEVKVALHLPYTVNSKSFERYDGTAEINGVTYSYVERKIQNDTLILHCLPNKSSDHIKLARNAYAGAVGDVQPAQKGQKSNNASLLLKSLVCSGYKTHQAISCNCMVFMAQRVANKTVSDCIADDKFTLSPEQPPDAA